MALDQNDLIRVATMHAFTAPEGTPAPDWETFNPALPTAPWEPFAYTARESVLELGKSGGDVTPIDTGQALGVDESSTPIVRTIDVVAVSLGSDQLDFAYNGSYNAVTKEYDVPSIAAPLVKDIYFYMKSVKGKILTLRSHGSISAGSEPTLSYSELSKVPLHVTVRPDANGKTLHWGGHSVEPAA